MLINFSGFTDVQSQSGYITILDLFCIFDIRHDHDRKHVSHQRSKIADYKIWRSILNGYGIFTCRLAQYRTSDKKSTYLYYNALSNKYEAESNVVKMNRSGKCESEIILIC